MSFKSFYLLEVLGVKKYICPKDVFSSRYVKGGLPCERLVVVQGELSLKQKELLYKIMKSIDFSKFTLLELKKLQLLESFMNDVESQRLAKFVIFFGEELSYDNFKQINSFKACSLSQLDGQDANVQARKKELWLKLKKWKEQLSN